MRIAFDVSGTLMGGHDDVKMRRLLWLCAQRGHNITVWSNLYSYTQDFIHKYPKHGALVHQTQSKVTKGDILSEDGVLFDLAFEDDHNQTYLGASNIQFVNRVPDDLEAYLDSLGVKDLKMIPA